MVEKKKRKAEVNRALPEIGSDTWKKSPEAGYTMEEHAQMRGGKTGSNPYKTTVQVIQAVQFFRLTVKRPYRLKVLQI